MVTKNLTLQERLKIVGAMTKEEHEKVREEVNKRLCEYLENKVGVSQIEITDHEWGKVVTFIYNKKKYIAQEFGRKVEIFIYSEEYSVKRSTLRLKDNN